MIKQMNLTNSNIITFLKSEGLHDYIIHYIEYYNNQLKMELGISEQVEYIITLENCDIYDVIEDYGNSRNYHLALDEVKINNFLKNYIYSFEYIKTKEKYNYFEICINGFPNVYTLFIKLTN